MITLKQVTEHKKKDVKWLGNVIYDMLTNTVYKGKRKWKDEYFDVPIIVEPEQWDKINNNFKKTKRM